MHYVIAIISIGLSVISQYFFKLGVNAVSQKANGASEIVKLGITNMHLWIGMFCYGSSLLIWFYVLSKMELSKAFPLVSIGYVFTLLLGYFLLNEAITAHKIIGITLIIAGVLFVAR